MNAEQHLNEITRYFYALQKLTTDSLDHHISKLAIKNHIERYNALTSLQHQLKLNIDHLGITLEEVELIPAPEKNMQ